MNINLHISERVVTKMNLQVFSLVVTKMNLCLLMTLLPLMFLTPFSRMKLLAYHTCKVHVPKFLAFRTLKNEGKDG